MAKIIVKDELFEERIDKFLFSCSRNEKNREIFDGKITRGEIIRHIKEGRIKVNQKKIKPSYGVKSGDEIDITIQTKPIALISNKNIKVSIIYQNDDFAIIDKPFGLQVHPSAKEEKDTLTNFLVAEFSGIENVNDGSEKAWMRPGIVHRLDRDTSGIMVVAKNKKTLNELKKQFSERKILKKYQALVFGCPKPQEGIIDEPIAKTTDFRKQKIAQGKIKGVARSAVTFYKIIKKYKEYALLELLPKTGRTHQLRVHLAHVGNPIVGDKKYGRRNVEQPRGVQRQLLHAKEITFVLKNEKFSFQSKLADDFADFLRHLD